MMSHEEWLHSDQTVMLVRWLEEQRLSRTRATLENASTGAFAEAAADAGWAYAYGQVLAKIRERKNNESL